MTAAAMTHETRGPAYVPAYVSDLTASLFSLVVEGEAEIAHAEALAAAARRHMTAPAVHDYQGKPRGELATLHAREREILDVCRRVIATLDAMAHGARPAPPRLVGVFREFREIFERLVERAWTTIDELEYEIDSIDAPDLAARPSSVISHAEAMRMLNLDP